MSLFLGIESSCDETAAAVVEIKDAQCRVLAEEISSQIEIHKAYGGVVPEIASRAHLTNLPLIVDKVMRDAALPYSALTAIGVTRGPGLKGCLLMGVSFAKALAWSNRLPLLGVNHIEGHIQAACLDNPDLNFPFLALVVSGGHTEILEVHGIGKYKLLARTTDDAAGEAFDKSANLLGFPYPGGAALAALADAHIKEHAKSSFKLPKVMRENKGFSFSGLKTAIALLVAQHQDVLSGNEALRADICAAVQEAIVEALCFKLAQSIRETGISKVCVTGGVSANRALRKRVQELSAVQAFFPKMGHCMDNAAMIAYVASQMFEQGQRDELDFSVLSRWPVDELSVVA